MDEEIRLIRKVQRTGNRDAADILIRKYYDEIYKYVYRQTSDKHISMDLTQNIFISMLQSIPSYDAKRSGFRTWLYRIATNKAVDYFRSNATERKYTFAIEDMDIPDEAQFISQIESRDLLLRLQEYVNSLDVSQQQIFRLKFFGEYTFSEIAVFLSVSESTVKSKYYRLLKAIRKEFEDEYD